MAAPNIVPHVVGGVVQVTGTLLGRGLIEGVLKHVSPRRQEERGDYFMERSRDLLKANLEVIPPDEQENIRDDYNQVRELKQRLRGNSVTGLERLSTAKEYKRLSKQTHREIQRASGEAIDKNLMAQIPTKRGSQVAPGHTFASTYSNPFTESHAISSSTNVSVNDLNPVEMSRRETGDRADKASQSVGTVALSEQEDGTSSHLVSTPPPHISPSDCTNEDAETRAVSSVTPIETLQVASGPLGQ